MSSELNLNKDKWKTVKLAELVENISIRVENPEESAFDKFVGLEQFVSGDLKIKTYKTTQGLVSAAKKFQSGDILFARRNAYLRRASMVEFDGICSGDAFVLRENIDHIVPGFLSFVFNSDGLWDYANANAAGTMSKRVKWRDLANYEFLLPPKEKQAEISELLWAIDKLIQKEEESLELLKNFSSALIEDFVPRNFDKSWKLGDVIKVRKGVTYKSTDYSDKENGIPLLNLKSIERGGGFNKAGIKYYKGSHEESHLAKNTDLIIACTDITRAGNVVGYPLNPSVYQNQKMLFTMDLMAIEITSKELIRDYLYYALKSKLIHWKLFANSPGTTVLHLDSKGMLKIKIPKFSIENQEIRVKKLKEIDKNILLLQEKIDSSRPLMKSLINRIF